MDKRPSCCFILYTGYLLPLPKIPAAGYKNAAVPPYLRNQKQVMSDPSGNDTPYANIKGFKGLLVQLQDTGKMDATADSIARNIFTNQSYSQAKLYEPNYYFITPAKPDTVKPQEAWNLSNLVQQYPDVIKAWPCFEFNRKPDDDWAGPGCAKHEPKALTKKLWHLCKEGVNALEAGTIKGADKKGAGITIGHFDSGFMEHYALLETENFQYWRGYNINEGHWDARPGSYDGQHTHGTSTASLIVGSKIGVAPNAVVIPYKISWFVLILDTFHLTSAMQHAVSAGCNVISMSLGMIPGDPLAEFADAHFKRLVEEYSVIPVAAAAQIGAPSFITTIYPGTSPYTVCCSAHDINGKPWDKEVTGKHVDVCAPGLTVWNAGFDVKTNTSFMSPGCGTSFSTAVMAGVAANWLSFYGVQKLVAKYGKNLFRLFMYELKTFGTEKSHPDFNQGKWGWGKVNMQKLLQRNGKSLLEEGPSEKELQDFYQKLTQQSLPSRQIEKMFFDIPPGKLEPALGAALGLPAEKSLHDIIDKAGNELLFHLAGNNSLQQQVRMHASGRFTQKTLIVDAPPSQYFSNHLLSLLNN